MNPDDDQQAGDASDGCGDGDESEGAMTDFKELREAIDKAMEQPE